jgi:hypothetical protein
MICAGAVGYGMLLAASPFIQASTRDGYSVWKAALQLTVLLVFTIRDVLFVQLCTLTRMRRPLGAAILYLTLYYAAAAVLATRFSEESGRWWFLNVLTPSGVSFPIPGYASIYTGILLQALAVVLLLSLIHGRLNRMALPLAVKV